MLSSINSFYSFIQSWYSVILNWYILTALQEGIDVIGTIEIILFFCHQCNNTMTFSRAFRSLLQDRRNNPKRTRNYYSELGKRCYEIKKEDTIKRKLEEDKSDRPRDTVLNELRLNYPAYSVAKDVGGGSHPRFVPSQCTVFNKVSVDAHVETILDLCNQMSTRMSRSHHDVVSLQIVHEFAVEFGKIPGIGPIKSQMMVQLCALFGLVPLEYYTFLPMHLNGGPGKFMVNEMGWHKTADKNLLEWNVQIVTEMQTLYNKEFTYNMFENAACEISRRSPPDDLHFAIPSIMIDPNDKKSAFLNYTNQRLQFFFRVDGNRSNNWRLQMYAGGKNKIAVFGNSRIGRKDPFMMSWTRAQSNGRLARSTKVNINLNVLRSLDKSILSS